MDTKTGDNDFIFDTVELGQVNQCNFFCPRNLKDEAEAWLDSTFNGLLMEFGADVCREILGGEAHVRREDKLRSTKQINAYLKNLNLNSVKEQMEEREAHVDAPPKKHLRQLPRLSFGIPKYATWGIPLYAGVSGVVAKGKKGRGEKIKGGGLLWAVRDDGCGGGTYHRFRGV